jgi:hypothetical protein
MIAGGNLFVTLNATNGTKLSSVTSFGVSYPKVTATSYGMIMTGYLAAPYLRRLYPNGTEIAGCVCC